MPYVPPYRPTPLNSFQPAKNRTPGHSAKASYLNTGIYVKPGLEIDTTQPEPPYKAKWGSVNSWKLCVPGRHNTLSSSYRRPGWRLRARVKSLQLQNPPVLPHQSRPTSLCGLRFSSRPSRRLPFPVSYRAHRSRVWCGISRRTLINNLIEEPVSVLQRRISRCLSN